MRKRRKILDGARYHVSARANRKEFIFKSDKIKNLFLNTVKRAKKKHKFSVTNFCIMNNHIHMLMQPLKNQSLSKIMQWILATFAINYNKIFGYSGHVWYDRFHSTVIYSFRQYVKTFIYISDNPVKAGFVRKADEYEFNGITNIKRGLYDILDPPELMTR